MKNIETRDEILRHQMVGLLPRLRRFALTLARDPDRADDLVQASCERALTRFDQLRKGTRLDSWLYRIIYTQWIDNQRRKKTRFAKLILLTHESRSMNPVTDAGNPLDSALDLQNALNRLPEEHQAALMLVSVEGYSYAEAASALEFNRSGIAQEWQAQQEALAVTVTPVKTYRDKNGRYFREYRLEIATAQERQQIKGLAYRTGTGKWKTSAIFYQ